MTPPEDRPTPAPGDGIPVEGVVALDHTADVGLELAAPTLAGLLERGALGMDWLLREAGPPPAAEARRVELPGADPPALLRAFLRELLLWFELDGFAPADIHVETASSSGVVARVRGGFPSEPPVREIKGVTLHRLVAETRDGGWWGRVIFDV
ncbi:MAG TPA: archease [Longimicrobiales bacterium]|nr:archease [Longimicrobiales bacterium]